MNLREGGADLAATGPSGPQANLMQTKEKLILDAQHLYWLGKENKPGFSEICANIGFPKNKFWTEDGRAEGQALHQWLLFLAQGNVPAEEPDPRIAGRVRGIQKFFRDHDFEFVGEETPLYCPSMGYCVTPDLWGRLDGVRTVIEAKRGAKMKRYFLQTAAQSMALKENGFDVEARLGLYLKDDGYTPEPHEDDEDFECWAAIVSGYHAKARYL